MMSSDNARINRKKLCRAAVALWGQNPQLCMVMEECSELITAISHYRRNRADSVLDVIREMIDVRIMLDQLEEILLDYGYGPVIEIETAKTLQKLFVKVFPNGN